MLKTIKSCLALLALATGTALLPICSAANENIDPSLLLWMPFDEGHGIITAARTPQALSADLFNVRWATGAFGNALHFDGTNAFVDLPSVPGLNGATQYSFALWALWNEVDTRIYPNLITSHTWSPGGLMVFVRKGHCSFRLGRPGHKSGRPGAEWQEGSTHFFSGVTPQRWTHLCATYANGEVKTYVNGKQVGRTAWPYPLEVDSLRLGGWESPVCHNGLIDDLRIYSRALSADEIAALAQVPTRTDAAYTLKEKPAPDHSTAEIFETRYASLVISRQGRVLSLRSKKNGRELLAYPWPLLSVTLDDGRNLAARSVTRHRNTLTFGFPDNNGTASIEIDTHKRFFTFTVRELTVTNAASLTFCTLPVVTTKYRGSMVNMLSDDTEAVCLRAYDLPVEMGLSSVSLFVTAAAEQGLTGWRAGLAAGAKADMPAMLRDMAADAGAPTSKLGGPWSLGAEGNRGSYLMAINPSHAATDDWIDIARRGGFSIVHLFEWWHTRGHYLPATNLFPNGLMEVKDTVQRIHSAGLRAGLHTLTACIDPSDPWVSPEAHPDLMAASSYTLARDLTPTNTVLYVNERPGDNHDTVFTYLGHGNAIQIGSEIIQYTAISRTPPYAFSGCTRGAFGTRTATHAAGERADYLQQCYLAFYPDPDLPLADAVADSIAHVYNTCEFDQIYFDGSEGIRTRYGIDVMRRKIFSRLKGNPLAEASCYGAHNWWFHSRLGAWDTPSWGAKSFHDKHIAVVAGYRDTEMLEPQMGWWSARIATPHARGLFLDESEYFACKNLGLDTAMSMSLRNVGKVPGELIPPYIEQHITLLGWYERLRLARAFDTQTVARVAVPGTEFRLRQGSDGEWRFTPVTMQARRVTALEKSSEQWTVNNQYASQPVSLRIEALYAAAPYDSPKRTQLIRSDEFNDFQVSSAPSVKLTLSTETADVQGGVTNLRLHVKNTGAASGVDAWACAAIAFPEPYRSIGWGTRAFGLWVKGDGKGAILTLQAGTPREFSSTVSDHVITLDFTGWRYVEFMLRERDVDFWADRNLAKYRRVLDAAHISRGAFYISHVLPGADIDIIVSPVMALPIRVAPLESPQLAVNGQKLNIPFTLAPGDFAEIEPSGVCTHYSEKGMPLARSRVAQATVPMLTAGENIISFACEHTPELGSRAEVTLNMSGTPFGTFNPRRDIGWEHLAREYEMPRLLLASNDVDNVVWDIAVRPGEKANLEVELWGAMVAPTLVVNGELVNFPVTLKADERLLCRDSRNWFVLDGQRIRVSEGKLAKKIPKLVSGANQIAFTCTSRGQATVKLTKVYE